MINLKASYLIGHYLILQRTESYIQLVSRSYPIKLIVARNQQRLPCEYGFYITGAFFNQKRFSLHIELYHHPERAGVFEFRYENAYYSMAFEADTASIEHLPYEINADY